MKILFICTHNRCRSILSEAITNHFSKGVITALSAGSQPVGQVHPLSIKYLEEKGINAEGLKSQSWDDFENDNVDVVVTVCDSAANETCPVWFGDCIKVHWGLKDPSKLEGSEQEIKDAFFNTIDIIEKRTQKLIEIADKNLDSDSLKAEIEKLTNEV